MSINFTKGKKQVRMIEPGDVMFDHRHGARQVLAVGVNMSGDFIISFGLPGKVPTDNNSLKFDRFWGSTDVAVIETNRDDGDSAVKLLTEQLAARDAALNAILNYAMSLPGDEQAIELQNVLTKLGIHNHG